MEQRRPRPHAAHTLEEGGAILGIELGSTRIKTVLVDADLVPIAQGAHDWENELVDGVWTYSLDAVEHGLTAAVAAVLDDAEARHGVRPRTLAGLGVSAMMHGYLALDAADKPLVPFRTWRNTSTGPAAAALTELLGVNIPLRWSVAHLTQAVLDDEPHLAQLARLTTLAGYVHHRLTGQHVLGVGDASGMFPIEPATGDYDTAGAHAVDALLAEHGHRLHLLDLLPTPLTAGADAGTLTEAGARFLDPSGTLRPGVPVAPPEGDAGTGMVATAAVRPRTGNVSVGTSIFAMVVLEQPLTRVHPEIDVVTTPAGDPVAMVHCNNGASELGAWTAVFGELADALGAAATPDEVFAAFLGAAPDGAADAGGIYAYNQVSGEPVAQLDAGAPLVVRTPSSRLTLANLARAQVYGVFATLSLGLRVLADEGVAIDSLRAHGGIFRTAGVAQRFCAAAVGAPVAVGETAGEGGAWGMAVLAALRTEVARGDGAVPDLADHLDRVVAARSSATIAEPDAADVAGYAVYLERYAAGLESVAAAARTLAPASAPAPAPAPAPASAPAPAPASGAASSYPGDSGTADDVPPLTLGSLPPEVQAEVVRVRAEVARLHAELPRWELVVWTAGNVSQRVRVPGGEDLLVIKPSGVTYEELTADSMVVCDLEGNLVEGDRAPSSDTAAHAYVYRHMPEVGGVVHTHSTYATAWAARGEEIPCVLTMMADEFGGPVPVGPFALIGDDSIGRGIVETLAGSRSPAVLMRSHGPFTIGRDASAAVKAAVMVEEVARTVHVSRQLGEPVAIAQPDIDSLYARYQNVYGQQ